MSETTNSVWRERLSSPLTWHYAGFAVLLVGVIVLAIRFGLDWSLTSSHTSEVLASKQVELRALQLQNAPLHGLDKRIADTNDEIHGFFSKRIPGSYSAFAEEIGNVAVKSGVRLSRLQYTQGIPGHDLTEVTMDAGVTGEYQQIMHFINSLERDKTFFVIRTMALTGQQGGMVNLRLRVSTWMRPGDVPQGLPRTGSASATPSAQEGVQE